LLKISFKHFPLSVNHKLGSQKCWELTWKEHGICGPPLTLPWTSAAMSNGTLSCWSISFILKPACEALRLKE